MQKTSLKAILFLIFGIFCIGWSAIFIRLSEVPGPVSAFYRVFIASLFLMSFWIIKQPSHPDKKAAIITCIGGVLFAIDLVLWNISLFMSKAAIATLLANNAPIWVGLGSMIIFKERHTYVFWIGVATAILGSCVIVGLNTIRHANLDLGSILALVAGVFYAGYLLTTQRARKSLDTITFMTISLVASSIFLLFICLVTNQPLVGFSYKTWGYLLALGIISHLGGWLSINYALGHMKAAIVSTSILSQTIITGILSIFFLGETLRFEQILGGIIVLTGVFFVNYMRK